MLKKKYQSQFFLMLAVILFWLMPLPAQAEEPADGGDKSGGFIFNESGYDPSQPGLITLPEEETAYRAGGGWIIWTPQKDGGGNVVSGRLTLRNAEIQNSNTQPDASYGSGIWMSVPFELVLEGENKITASGYGIFLADSSNSSSLNLTIRGSGSLTIDSGQHGIIAHGKLLADAAQLTVTYGFGAGIMSDYGDVVIQNGSRVTVKSSDSAVVGSTVRANNGGDIIMKNSYVTAVNKPSGAVTTTGNVRFESSEIRAVGANLPVSGGTVTVSGGSLYVKNTGGVYDIYPDPGTVKFVDSAVIYCGGAYNYLIQQGDNIQYADCVYDEASGQVTSVGNGRVYGDVIWNDYIRFPQGADQQVYIGVGGSTLTIPKGVTAEIPENGMLRNSYSGTASGTLVNYGTLNIAAGGTLYNYDGSGANGGHQVVMKNYGEINVAPGGVFFNAALLENSGTINLEGSLVNVRVNFEGDPYSGSIQNTGTIHGFVNERDTGVLKYLAERDTVLKTGQTLTLGENTVSGKWDTVLEIPSGGSLTVAEGAVVDAKTHVTKETLSTYLKANSTFVVDGILLLPPDVSEKNLEILGRHLAGKGIVKLGDVETYIIVFDRGDGNTESRLLTEGSQFSLPPDPVKDGYIFEGWYVNQDGTETAAEETMTVSGGMVIYAKWKAIDTGGDSSDEEKPEGGRPAGIGGGSDGGSRPVFRPAPAAAAKTGDLEHAGGWLLVLLLSLMVLERVRKYDARK